MAEAAHFGPYHTSTQEQPPATAHRLKIFPTTRAELDQDVESWSSVEHDELFALFALFACAETGREREREVCGVLVSVGAWGRQGNLQCKMAVQ